uniref:Uncharacterized protein n=1 Tax=Arundo donax TaxID=35708 RepID=A0A0A8YRC8_ARUDO
MSCYRTIVPVLCIRYRQDLESLSSYIVSSSSYLP